MKPERWKQIDELLEAVVDYPATERASVLDQLCEGDAELRRELESLVSLQKLDESKVLHIVGWFDRFKDKPGMESANR